MVTFKFGDDRFRGFWLAEGQSLPFPIYFEGRRYNTHTTVWCVINCLVTALATEDNTRSPTVSRITDRTGCQWFSRSSMVDDFYFIWKGLWYFLLVSNSNLGPISHRFRDMASFSLKNAHFSYPPPLNPTWKCSSWSKGWNFACPSVRHIANFSCKDFPLCPTR